MSMTTDSFNYFERVAGEWDTLRAGYFSEAVREAAINKAYLHPEQVVADVGSGTGFMAAGLAPLVRRVYVLDGSPAMLDAARRNLSGLDNVIFEETDGQSLPLPDQSVDAVFTNMYLHHCPDPVAAIQEMIRVLRPGGRLVITDLDSHSHEWVREEMADVWLGFDRGQMRVWLREGDLVNVVVDDTRQSCCAGCQDSTVVDPDGRSASVSIFVATGSRRVVGSREAVQSSYGALAVGATRACCPAVEDRDVGADRVEFETGYTMEELDAVPSEAASISLGCGNPVALASLQPGEVVLDIGSGGGIDVFYAVQRVGPTGRVIGLDMTPAMIERARESALEAGLDNVEFRLGQAAAMPVEDGSVDVVLSNCVINLCEDKGKVFEEAYRVLKEGGHLEISDMVSDGPLPPKLRSHPASWAGCVSGALPEREYLDLVAHAGFREIVTGRSEIGGVVQGVRVYSLSVSARKRQA